MLSKIEHIGIAVANLPAAIAHYEILLNTTCYKQEIVASEHVTTAFFEIGPNKIELLAATSPESAIAKFIDKRGEGMHHIAYAVDNIYAAMEYLKTNGYTLLNEQPKAGADNKLICFVHPKETHGVLMELCQEIKNV
jgi:methylmalonyl-CoA/ethylmalonyl-CoA epimerase